MNLHRVDILLRPSGAHDDLPARQVARPSQHQPHVAQQLGRLQQPSLAHQPRRQPAHRRSRDRDPPRRQRLHVRLRRWAVVHVRVHRRADDHRRGCGQYRRANRVVRESQRQLRDRLRGGWRDNHHVGPFRYGDVVDQQLRARVEQALGDRPVGDRGKGQGRNELPGRRRHHHVDLCPQLHQLAGQVDGLVAGYAPADAQGDVPALQRPHGFRSWMMRRPVSVRFGATWSKTRASDSMSPASPPVATTVLPRPAPRRTGPPCP